MRIEELAEAKMYDEDRDALAAEYVLGTLSAQEREQAEALLSRDSGFAQIVRVWEHRLGELNVMVEAVDPPPDVWARIKSDIEVAEPNNQETAAGTAFVAPEMRSDIRSDLTTDVRADPHAEQADLLHTDPHMNLHTDLPAGMPNSLPPGTQANTDLASEQSSATIPDLLADHAEGPREAALVDGLAATLLARESSSELDRQLSESPTVGPASPTKVELLDFDHSVRRWRGAAIAASVVAALLAVYVVAAQFVPGLVASGRQSQFAAAGGRPAGSRLLAVLQQDPTAPAFLVMLDPQERNITVRRLTAAPDTGRSYELWLTSAKSPKPASLGLVGGAEFTNRPIPANLDLEAMQNASYSVSLEPAAGSPTGAPSGPMLFKGRMVEAAPAASR